MIIGSRVREITAEQAICFWLGTGKDGLQAVTDCRGSGGDTPLRFHLEGCELVNGQANIGRVNKGFHKL